MAETEDRETLARAHLPYRAEYCKTSRASCKKCSESMPKDSLKLANMTKSRFHDGYDASYYHVPCFFQIKRPNSVAEILNFEILKYDDQKMLEKAVETKGLSVLGSHVQIEDSKSSKSGGSKRKKKDDKKSSTSGKDGPLVNYNDFVIEYAKSSRSKCICCEEKIEKDSVRIGKLDYDAETAWNGGPIPRWHHVECFAKSQEKLGFFGTVDKIKDFGELEKEDRKMLLKSIKPVDKPKEINDESTKKVKKEDDEAAKKEEKLLKKQSDRYFKLREFVSTMKYKDIELMLKSMDQKSSFKANNLLVDMATDVLLFGPLGKCPICKKTGGIVLRHSSYICTNQKSELEPCTYESRDPKRTFPDLPDEIFEAYPFFQDTYTFKEGRKRIFPSKFVKAVEQKEAENNNLVQEGAPLDGLSIGVISWSSVGHDKVKVEKKVQLLGGKVRGSLDSQIFVILSSEHELKKTTPKVEVAKALDIPFVTADFLFEIKTKEDVVRELRKCLIGEWTGDLDARFERMLIKEKSKPGMKAETSAETETGTETKVKQE